MTRARMWPTIPLTCLVALCGACSSDSSSPGGGESSGTRAPSVQGELGVGQEAHLVDPEAPEEPILDVTVTRIERNPECTVRAQHGMLIAVSLDLDVGPAYGRPGAYSFTFDRRDFFFYDAHGRRIDASDVGEPLCLDAEPSPYPYLSADDTTSGTVYFDVPTHADEFVYAPSTYLPDVGWRWTI